MYFYSTYIYPDLDSWHNPPAAKIFTFGVEFPYIQRMENTWSQRFV